MTKNHLIISLLVLFATVCKTTSAQGGTVLFSLIHSVCNNDGILVAHDTTTTLPPPFTFYWYSSNGNYYSHVSSNGYDTLFNYDGNPVQVNSGYPGLSFSQGQYAGALPFSFTNSTTIAVCPALGTAEIFPLGGTPPYTYQWLDANDSNRVVATGNPVSLPAGGYYAIVTDSNGCVVNNIDSNSSTNPFIVVPGPQTVIANVTATDANCTNGTAKVASISAGTSPFGYRWSNGATSAIITGLSQGRYNVTITDAQGCKSHYDAYVQQTTNITVHTTITDAPCLQNDGSAIAFASGGTPPYSYQWTNGQTTQSIINMPGGYNTVSVTDANHCTGSGAATIGFATPINVTNNIVAGSCLSPTGSATLIVTGGTTPYSIAWQTYPIQTGATATNLAPGSYGFTVTDALGCKRTGSAYVPPISIIVAAASGNDAMCLFPNGNATVLVSSAAFPCTYNWSNGATTPTANGLLAGYYSCTITDSLGCSVVKSVQINSSSPVNVILNTVDASCIFSHDGQSTAMASGGAFPYSYYWSNGQTTNSATGLASGNYTVWVQDANGCESSAFTNVGYNPNNDRCYCTLTGRVFVDTNTNCLFDAGETPVHNIMIHCSGVGYTFTDNAGYYSFKVPSGNYTLSENIQAYYPLASCQSNSVSVTASATSGCVISRDFANVINPIHDLKITAIDLNHPIPGFNYLQRLVVQNDGTDREDSIQVGYHHDGQLLLNTVIPNIFVQQNSAAFPNSYSIVNSFPSLSPTGYQVFDITYNVPTNIPLGTNVVFEDTTAYQNPMSSWLSDYSPWNNVGRLGTVVVGSFDPNEKAVSPQGITSHGYITDKDSILTYTIHFQNTGSYPAQKVVVIDSLDKSLDISTIKLGYSNYPYTATMSDSGVLKFTFDNIQLPAQSYNPIASIGMVMYTIHQKPNLAFGTEIKSPANIYFDYNAPVATNAALNTIGIGDTTSVANTAAQELGFVLYPNPANGNVTLSINCDMAAANSTIRILNLMGEEVLTKHLNLTQGKNLISLNISSLSSGFYFVELSDGQQRKVQKLSVNK